MSTLQDVKAKLEVATGVWRPAKREALAAVRKVRAVSYRFSGGKVIPNNPDLPLVVYKRALSFAKTFDPAALIEEAFAANGWRDSWRDGIYDWMHFHSHTHEVLGIAKGRARVRFGGDGGRDISIAAGDVIVLPAGTGHQRLTASDDLLVVGAYPAGGSYDERKVAGRSTAQSIARVPLPKADPIYGKTGGIVKLWQTNRKARA